MSKRIIIVTAPVNFGKTTALQNWSSAKSNVGGILTPDVNSYRKLFRIRDKKVFNFQVSDIDKKNYSETEILAIGKYLFLISAFNIMNEILLEDINSNYEYLIIDELGKLEMKGLGLSVTIKEIIKITRTNESNTSLIIVIRDYLLEQAFEEFDLMDAEIISLAEDRVFRL